MKVNVDRKLKVDIPAEYRRKVESLRIHYGARTWLQGILAALDETVERIEKKKGKR